MKKPLTEKQFKLIYKKVPRLCVDLIIVKGKKILLTKRSIEPFNGSWHFPGGSVFYREKLTEAVKRIAKNEIGVKVIPQKFLGFMEVLNDGFRHSLSLAYKCKIYGNQKPKPIKQASQIDFFEKLPKGMIKFQREFIRKNREKIFG